jgi:hypothetical protein
MANRQKEGASISQAYPANRRDFVRIAASTLGAAIVSEGIAPAAPIEPMKVGVFGLDYSFWSIWADILSPKGKHLGASVLRMRPTHVWDKDVKKAHDFAAQWDCEVVPRYDGMLGKVDAVLNGELNSVPWQASICSCVPISRLGRPVSYSAIGRTRSRILTRCSTYP